MSIKDEARRLMRVWESRRETDPDEPDFRTWAAVAREARKIAEEKRRDPDRKPQW